MTLRNRKNHYNAKFLMDYGFSIKVKDSKIVLKNSPMELIPKMFHFLSMNLVIF